MVRVVARWGTSGCCRPTNVSVWSVGDRCPAARFSCDADDRAEPPFRLAVRHGSYAGSLTLGKSCENPVGRSDRPSGDSAGIAPPRSQPLLRRRASGRRSRRAWCHVSQACGRNRPRGRPTRGGCSSRSADPSGSRCSPSGSGNRRELRCQIVAKGTRAAAPSLRCEGHRRVPSRSHLTTVNCRHLTRWRGAWLSARSGPRTTVSAPKCWRDWNVACGGPAMLWRCTADSNGTNACMHMGRCPRGLRGRCASGFPPWACGS